MDPPQLHHHHHRYVPPPPPPPNFPDSNPNFFSHHRFPPPPPPPHHRHPPPHHHHHPLPPPPPPPLPPPPPPPPHQHFTFHHHHRPPPPMDDHQSHFSNFIPHHFLSSSPPPQPPPPPRVSSSHRNRFSEENNNSCNNDYINYHPHRWVEMPPRVRVSPEQPLPPPPPPQQLPQLPCHEEYHPRLNFRSGFDDFERNDRVREEHYGDDSLMFSSNGNSDMSVLNGNEERRWDRKDLYFHGIDDDVNKYRFRNVGHYDEHSPRDYAPNVGNYEVYNERDEGSRWGRYSPRDLRMERDSEYGSARRDLLLDSYDSGRFRDNHRVKENGQEFFIRSPKKKQVQKKSALLRIQLGKGVNSNRNRNRTHEYSQYSKGYFDESLTAGASFRGKEKDGLMRSDRRMDEKKEKSPVQLDVSFKSNSLVAKAIVTSSSPPVDSDRNSTPRNRKIRKINLSSSPLIKPIEDSCKVNNFTTGSDYPSNSGKSWKRSLFNTVSADGSASGSGLQPCSIGCNDMAESDTNTVSPKVKALDGGGNSAGASGTPLRKIKKRMKFTASPADESVQQPVKDADELTKADKFSENPITFSRLDDGMRHRGQGDASPDVVSVPAVALSQFSSDKVDKSSNSLVSEKNDVDIDASRPLSATLSNSSCRINTDSSTSQIEVVKVIQDGADQADRSNHNCDSVSVLDTSSAKLQPKSTLSGSNEIVELSKEPCQDGLALSENALRRVSLEVAVSVEGYLNSNLSMTKGMGFPVVHRDTTDINMDDQKYIYASHHAGYITMDANPVFPGKAEGLATDDVGSRDAGSKECSVTQTILFLENGNNENTRNLSCSNHSSDTSRLTISSSTGCGGKGNVSDPSCFNDGSKKSCFNLSVVPLEDGLNTGSLKAVVSVGSIEDYSHKVERKRKAVDPQLSLYSSGASDVPANLGSCINIEDAGIISLLNDISAVKELVCPDRDNDTLCRGNLGGAPLSIRIPDQDAFGISENVASPMNVKKRKHNEGPDNAYTSTLSTDVSSCVDKGTLESEGQITLVSVDLPSSLMPAGALPENCTAGASFEAESTADGVSKKSKKLELLSSSTFLSDADPKEDAASVISVTKHRFSTTDVVSQGIADKLFDMEIDQSEPGRDCEFDDSLPMNDNLESALNHPSFCANREGASAVNSVEELTDSFLGGLSRMDSPESFIKSPSEIDDSRASAIHLPDEMVCQNDKESHKRPLSASDSELDRRAGQAAMRKPPTGIKTASSLSKVTSKVIPNNNCVWVKSKLSKNHLGSLVPSVLSGRPSLNFTVSGKSATLNHNAKPRTWRRTDNPSGSVRGPKTQVNPVPQQNYAQKKAGTLQSSYIRKGNSLVRNPSPIAATSQGIYASSVYRFNSLGVNNSKKGKESDTNPQISAIPGGSHATNERPQTPPLCSSPKLLSSANLYVNDSTSLPRSDLLSPIETSGPVESTTNMDLLKSCEDVSKFSGLPECQTDLIKNIEGQSLHDERIAGKKITYVKRRSNQLVAALGAGDMSFCQADKTHAPTSSSSSDSFYKRRKNQLIRTLLDNHVQETVAPADDLRKQGIQKIKQSGKGNAKAYRPLKFSLVWTLRGTESSKSDGNSVRCHKAWPYLFPWKRTTYLRNSMSISRDSSVSMISRKLLLSRKRESIYTRSTSGFSLRRSKVLSVGGSNLKWSKSIERKSKKANEEATLAVAAADKSKKEQHTAASAVLSRKNHVSRKSVCCIKLQPGERIFRIGSERYKMDPTRKSLHRITNDENKLLRVPQTEETKKSYVPRRLLIGNDEYVRIGNGNKLVRDPKKRTRTLASEKVRWSLHTVRLRLAKRRKYCQFFTRFGTCNKDDGKCPYIHDPSKIAVCTKFLNGSCSNPSCKLTHEVIPERMPDCSYFLQGLCSNGNCSYRHVNVNPSASICEGFLKGYCVDGNECRKKHTYVCPAFEATGVCPRGSKCKLHHPKKRKGTRKATREQKNARGRYFGSPSHINMMDGRPTESDTLVKRDSDDIFCEDGSLVGYISLGISDDEMEQAVDSITQQARRPGPSDAQISTLDELIKPIRLMKKSPVADSAAMDSPSEMSSTDML